MRLYLPATWTDLTTLTTDPSGWDVELRLAHAVTDGLRAALDEEDEEGWEFSAFLSAADDSLAMLILDETQRPVRVVLTVEVTGGHAEPGDSDGPPSQLRWSGATATRLVCAHVDEVAAESVVEVIRSVDAGPALDAAVEAIAEADLLWFDADEIPGLVASR